MNYELSIYRKPMTSHTPSGLAGSQWMLLHMQRQTSWPPSWR